MFTRCQARADGEGETVDEAATEAVRRGVSEACWQALVRRGQEYGRAMGDASQKEAERIEADAAYTVRAGRKHSR